MFCLKYKNAKSTAKTITTNWKKMEALRDIKACLKINY